MILPGLRPCGEAACSAYTEEQVGECIRRLQTVLTSTFVMGRVFDEQR